MPVHTLLPRAIAKLVLLLQRQTVPLGKSKTEAFDKFYERMGLKAELQSCNYHSL
jgi:hypothetical protein